MTVAHNASLACKTVNLPATQAWVKLLDEDHTRTYLLIQNDHDIHSIAVGFGTNTTEPTSSFNIKGSTQTGDLAATFEFSVAPINAVWAKVNDAQAHEIEIVYDD